MNEAMPEGQAKWRQRQMINPEKEGTEIHMLEDKQGLSAETDIMSVLGQKKKRPRGTTQD